MEWWSWLLTAVTGTGLLLAAHRRVGWLVCLAGQGLWLLYALDTQQYGFLPAAGVFAAIYARNWRR